MIYLASPYSHPDPLIEQARFEAVAHIAAHLLACDVTIYSPILHCHPIRTQVGTPGDFNFWAKYNREMVKHSTAMIVAMIDGWEVSKGVAGEIAFAKEFNKPVMFFDPKVNQIKDNP